MLTRLNTWLQPINERFELQVSQQIPKVIIFFINLFDPNDVNAQKMKFSIKDFSSKSDQTCGFGHIYWRIPWWKTSFFV